MIQKLLFFSLLTIFTISISAQTNGDETFAVSDSKLTAINLPSGAQRVNDASVPQEIRNTLSKLVASGGDQIRQGESEVVLWEGNYSKTKGTQMIKKLETSLKNSGWEYEAQTAEDGGVLFSIFRIEPARRALVGFFVPTDEAFVLAVTEMLRRDSLQDENKDQMTGSNNVSGNKNMGNQGIYGKWFRTVGGGYRDYTGKTKYNAGEDFYFEFFPDGTVEYTYKKNVLSIMQCKINGENKARGKFSTNGNTLIINLGPMKSIQTDSCDSKGNYNKTLEASTVKVQFEIKKMESITRPDNPTIMCFDGSEEVCYEKTD